MAYLNETRKVIFVHIYKTGGTTVRQVLAGVNHEISELGKGHEPAWLVQQILDEDDRLDLWDDCFTFGIIRNPYEWLTSLYYHEERNAKNGITLNAFIKELKRSKFRKEIRAGFEYYNTQKSWLYEDGEQLVEAVFSFEELEHCIDTLGLRLGEDFSEEVRALYLNKAPNRPAGKRALDLLNDTSVKIINELYAEDFEEFGYTMH